MRKSSIFFSIALILVSFVHAKIEPLDPSENYSLSYWEAYAACKQKGGALATLQELQDALDNEGLSHCSCGWTSDKISAYPINFVDPGCGGSVGVHRCNWRSKWNAYCWFDSSLPECSKPLGFESGTLINEKITASSVNHAIWREPWSPGVARLNQGGLVNAWMPNHDGRNQYIQVSFDEVMTISAVSTQGASRYTRDQYVKQFTVKFLAEGSQWFDYLSGKIFEANNDDDTHVRNVFNPPIQTTSIRIYPYSWHRHITMRVELFGCTGNEHQKIKLQQKASKLG